MMTWTPLFFNTTNKLILLGDVSVRVGTNQTLKFEVMIGSKGICNTNDLLITNTFFHIPDCNKTSWLYASLFQTLTSHRQNLRWTISIPTCASIETGRSKQTVQSHIRSRLIMFYTVCHLSFKQTAVFCYYFIVINFQMQRLNVSTVVPGRVAGLDQQILQR